MPSDRSQKQKSPQPRSSQRGPPAAGSGRGPHDFPVVGIGASAGGLDACRKFFGAVPADSGMAFILIQHLDPTHQSMMVDLLTAHTPIKVQQAADGMRLERNSLYVIPPGVSLSVQGGTLRVSAPRERHGARLPFDFLLHSLAKELGEHAICVVLSGMGTDGSLGAKAIKEHYGLVVAQDPNEADYDSMPRSAIKTGVVDLVLPAADIPAAIVSFDRRATHISRQNGSTAAGSPEDWLSEIIALLRVKTGHDFGLYKPGTLQRRIERRMAMAAIGTDGVKRYLEILGSDPTELDLLAKDLLIHVTSFFRDSKVFDTLAGKIIPDIVRHHDSDRPLRIWIAGCSTGEETYSLVMLFQEQIAAVKRPIKLQVFASDVDTDAVASAREGVYPETIEAEVSHERLSRFFTKEDHSYRVSADMRAVVVFTVQDLLADPPFSRLDMVSCRNLLIYLRPEAQAKVISLFHFALREGGMLLLGSSEAVGEADDRFEVISKAARIYRHVATSRPGEAGFAVLPGTNSPAPRWQSTGSPLSRQAALAEFCRRKVLEGYAPAAVLINQKRECLYSLGPTDRYLRVAPELRTNDVLSMVHERTRIRLRSALQKATQDNARVVIAGGRADRNGATLAFNIAIEPLRYDDEDLLLVCFVDTPKQDDRPVRPAAQGTRPRDDDLRQELESTRSELEDAVRSLEISSEEQRAVNETLLSVNEEYQSTNEELLTSKEELQSLNEELTALNNQLQETLEQQRRTSNDLQNVLYSTAVATLFLDRHLNIRFFTPATNSLFNIIAGDIGRPLADLKSEAIDQSLIDDARSVLHKLAPVEREIEVLQGWYIRRILPYRTHEGEVEGVVITFADTTERKRTAEALEAAKQEAEQANVAKSRFLAAASHDIRQPLQTLSLLQGVLAKTIVGEKGANLVSLMGQTLSAMTGMLNTLLDINQIDAGIVRTDMEEFRIDALLGRLRDEFSYHAEAKGLSLRVVPCSLLVYSDRQLLEQMLRNILQNAVKYTKRGKILLGCRRRGRMLSIEIWDTGLGIPEDQLDAVFDEYHQVDNAPRERSRGLGLGLSIVHRLGALLNHRLRVRSRLGKGSVFAIEILPAPSGAAASRQRPSRDDGGQQRDEIHRTGEILVIEDDPEVRAILGLVLRDEGHGVVEVPDGIAALDLVDRGSIVPDLILADYNLPDGVTGLQAATRVRQKLHSAIPVIVLTGDISKPVLHEISQEDCVKLNKPVDLHRLSQMIQGLLRASLAAPRPAAEHPTGAARPSGVPVIFVVDDDRHVREAMRRMLEEHGWAVEIYEDSESFLAAYRPGQDACLLVDASLPGMSGLELLQHLRASGGEPPAVMITGKGDVPMAVNAMKAGAADFIEKPAGRDDVIASVERALEQSRSSAKRSAWHEDAKRRIGGLTERQRQILEAILAGEPSKSIAADLGISQRTVEHHRAAILKRTGVTSLPALARLALAAGNGAEK